MPGVCVTREDRVFLWQLVGGTVAVAMVIYAFQDTLMHPAMGLLGLASVARVFVMGWSIRATTVDKRD